ncbi:glutathione S-transferase C-terminal domain-containing protein [Streptomyces sp. NBC_01803]|uniref:glutathione S-transferase C-terminal domain-containing protein n=1 Tax=Streptomyces sp. NBC_01803 TaxID=2975946 RepID=UPI002DDC3899|nr:glutathione S-transferase C-terminal domain-containing protein [Streptomyces sp. NBC_01803]WSA43483.1 glutathione S-transferase C-terminal domain-containing protein [Streptomyces sp. NBC_01803]
MPATTHTFRGRIGPDARHGYYAAPYRYRLYLSLSCPGCLRVAITHGLLGLGDRMPLVPLPAVPDADGGYAELRAAYERTAHDYRGPATAPALVDRWSGRVVNNHAPDILRDLTTRFAAAGRAGLRPPAAEREIAALAVLCDRDISEAAQRAGAPGDGGPDGERERAQALRTLLAALAAVEERLAGRPFLTGDDLTAADVHLWVTLVQLDTVHRWHLGADAVRRIADHPRLWAYARRLLNDPAFGSRLRVDDIARRHHAHCRGLEAAGAAVRIIDWSAVATPPVPGPEALATPAARRPA